MVKKDLKAVAGILGLAVLSIVILVIFFALSSNRIETEPKQMQFAYCDGKEVKPVDYIVVNGYMDKHIMARTAYFALWDIGNQKCHEIVIKNSIGDLLLSHTNGNPYWENAPAESVQKISMMRTVYPHTFSSRAIVDPSSDKVGDLL